MPAFSAISTSEREALILSHLPQVELLARRQHRKWPQIELDDLISAGTIGLIQAVDRYDPSRNLKLKTFAEHRIRGALMDYLRQLDPLSRTLREFQKKRDGVLQRLSATPTCEQAAQLLGLSNSRYVRLCLIVSASETISIEDAPLRIQRLAS
jgi:RNA polymerase sigma factor for flagellar operon FliA